MSETEAGRKSVKASEDRWVQGAVRRSDIIFAEAEEKKRRTEEEQAPEAAEATLTGGSSGSAGPTTASAPAPSSRKRRPDVDIEDIDLIEPERMGRDHGHEEAGRDERRRH